MLEDRPSAPHRVPHALPRQRLEKLRRQRWTVPEIAAALSMPTWTVTAACSRLGLNRLSRLEPVEPPNRYERRHPGDLIHVDIKRFGKFDQPGHRVHGDRRRNNTNVGSEYVHVAVDDATRLAYVEILDAGETAEANSGFLIRAIAWFAARGVTLRRVMTDNGSGYLSHPWTDTCDRLGLRHLRTRPYRPRTNGKAERFIQLLQRKWAYAVPYPTSENRRRALPAWLHYYNHHRPPSSLSKQSPGQRLHQLNNLAGIYSYLWARLVRRRNSASRYNCSTSAAYRSTENRARARSLPARPISALAAGSFRSRRSASASARGSRGGTNSPVTPSSVTSGIPPTRVATTGSWHSMASAITRPKASRAEGSAKTSIMERIVPMSS